MDDAPWVVRVWRSPSALLAGLAFVKILIHVLTNGNYGYFRDEFYYIACSDNLAGGYVDHPPLSILILKITRSLLGDSIFAIRLPVVLSGAVSVFLTGVIARELGGGRFAQFLAALCSMAMAVSLAMATFFSMNAFDHLFWIVCAWIAVRIVKTEKSVLWLVFGAVAGLGLMNKISIGFFGFGIVVGLLLTPQRKQFLRPWIWLGGAVALLIFLPHVVWQAANDFPTLEFMSNAQKHKMASFSPLGYLAAQALMTNPFTVVVWATGLGYLLLARPARPYRLLAFAYLAVLALFMIQGAKPYYLTPAYPMLMAAGAVAVEQSAQQRQWNWLPPALAALVALGGAIFAPLAMPVLSPETLLRYQAFLGVEPVREERGHAAPLSQHFADRFGWENMVATVARVYHSLPPEDQARCAIYAANYGEAGAVDFFGSRYALPKAISGHNNYWLWGPRDATGEIVLAIGKRKDELQMYFEQVELAETAISVHAQEREIPICICRRSKKSLRDGWPQLKMFI